MSERVITIVFWQRMVSPHMVFLALELKKNGHEVFYAYEMKISSERRALGWVPPVLDGVKFINVQSADDVHDLLHEVGLQACHLMQGVRGNGIVGVAQKIFKKKNIKFSVILETIDDRGIVGFLKNIYYSLYLLRFPAVRYYCIGRKTLDWMCSRGVSKNKLRPFAYFLGVDVSSDVCKAENKFSFIFVGRLVPLKRVDLLIQALSLLVRYDFNLKIVGNGDQFESLKILADAILPNRVSWLGILPSDKVMREIESADCLVLPSSYDGWGAVVSEALLCGTRVICSDACGASIVVNNPEAGNVFEAGNFREVASLLEVQLIKGMQTPENRLKLRNWATCLNAKSGADYLEKCIECDATISPPWEVV